MEFEGGDSKGRTIHTKHGVPFAYAAPVFFDPNRLEIPDTREDHGEDRFIVVGEIEDRVFVVVATWRNPSIRIISARKANKREQAQYRKIQD